MASPWLVLDCNYLCYRAFHAMRGLSHGGIETGVIYGFLRDLQVLEDSHASDRFVFCFDYGVGLREQEFPFYKASRRTKQLTEEHAIAYSDLRRQMDVLREDILPFVGFKNILFAEGFEADDIIASVCHSLKDSEAAIIVSTDHDLYQLLRSNVWMWNPQTKKAYTDFSLIKEFGVKPQQWAKVKAIAGCKTDDIPGIVGIGEKTAAKYVAGTLNRNHVAYDRIVYGREFWKKNLQLVRLPYRNTPAFPIERNRFNLANYRSIVGSLGMQSLLKKVRDRNGK